MDISTAIAGLIALVGSVVLWTAGKKKIKYLNVFFAVCTGSGLVEGLFGSWLRGKLSSVFGAGLGALQSSITNAEASEIIGLVASAGLIIIGLTVTAFFGFRLYNKQIDGWTLILAVATPVAVNLLPGGLAEFLSDVLAAAPYALGAVLEFCLNG